ncbi:GNAT family N-acetyltransferase [Methanolobus sp. ZRKC3]|uniref:GNAT family N-acetyltransferase n=1 Tax=Methanolobus sp. ZRKC3 TaxID=3125786 RepID=UPI0032497058
MEIESQNSIISIRQTSEADTPIIMDFIKGIADFEGLSDLVTATEDELRGSLFGKRQYAEAVIAEVDAKAAGFLIFFHNFSSFRGKPGIYIEDIYVHQEFRGKGVGRALMTYCRKVAKERNCGKISWSVLDWNPARKFYEHIGGQFQDEWLAYHIDEKGIEELANKCTSKHFTEE